MGGGPGMIASGWRPFASELSRRIPAKTREKNLENSYLAAANIALRALRAI